MRLFLCFIFPPFAVMLHGKPFSAIFNMLLCMFFWVPGVIHALAVNSQAHESRQTKKIVRAIEGKGKKKPRKPCPVHDRPMVTRSVATNDKFIGEGGTKFKRR